MSRIPLIDSIVKGDHSTLSEINGKWYIAKPIGYGGITELFERISHALQVVCGKAFCYKYAEDEKSLKEGNNEESPK